MGDLLQQLSGAAALRQGRALCKALENLSLDPGVIDADRSRNRDRQSGEQRQSARAG